MKIIASYHSENDSNEVRCAQCNKFIAVLEDKNGTLVPAPEELYHQGYVPVPNFGWFCSQDCGNAWGKENEVNFQRADGRIDYYPEPRKNN